MRKAQILHTRLRTNCSSLNLDLFLKNISDSLLCRCSRLENAQHFFFHCTHYQTQRTVLLNAVSAYQTPSLNVLLYGDISLSLETNVSIFAHVQKFIPDTNRFWLIRKIYSFSCDDYLSQTIEKLHEVCAPSLEPKFFSFSLYLYVLLFLLFPQRLIGTDTMLIQWHLIESVFTESWSGWLVLGQFVFVNVRFCRQVDWVLVGLASCFFQCCFGVD